MRNEFKIHYSKFTQHSIKTYNTSTNIRFQKQLRSATVKTSGI